MADAAVGADVFQDGRLLGLGDGGGGGRTQQDTKIGRKGGRLLIEGTRQPGNDAGREKGKREGGGNGRAKIGVSLSFHHRFDIFTSKGCSH